MANNIMDLGDEFPTSLIEQVAMMERTLEAVATGGDSDDDAYTTLRRAFISDPELKDLLPEFVRTCRTLKAFWPFIQQKHAKYAGRRAFISQAFTPLVDHLEGKQASPGDKVVSDALETFDVEGVHALWMKALARRNADPEGAITVARTLLEAVCIRILDELAVPYNDKDDLPKLYALAASELKLAPHQHTQEAFKAILGGAMNLVNGIGTLRNKFSDAHARGAKLPVKPSPRHAHLAVNTAGAIATFLVETFAERSKDPVI